MKDSIVNYLPERLKPSRYAAHTSFRLILLACCMMAQLAHAQLHLPSGLPGGVPVGIDTIDTINANRGFGLPQVKVDTGGIELQGLTLRKNRDQLLRRYGDRLEADSNGDPIVRGEIVAYLPSAELLERAAQQGFTIVRRNALKGTDANTVVLRPKRGVSTQEGLKRLRELSPDDVFDLNHVYGTGGQTAPASARVAGTQSDSSSGAMHDANAGRRVGLIDGGVDGNTNALKKARINRNGCQGRTLASAHGTAVASIMVGQTERFQGVAPGAELFAADVYCNDPTGGSLDAIATAFAWMAEQRVPVINVSLVGPPNRILERIVADMIARGHLIVAAVGNDGPAAPRLYPASYPDVVGVTAVDAALQVLPEAARGPQVACAAPGADMAAANIPNGYTSVRGTSFAAPIVAGLLALLIDTPERAQARQALARLARTATDLGPPGKDPIYGFGLVGREARIALSQVR